MVVKTQTERQKDRETYRLVLCMEQVLVRDQSLPPHCGVTTAVSSSFSSVNTGTSVGVCALSYTSCKV